MKHIVGVADMKTSGQRGDMIVTHALGSCLGVTVHDPIAHVGGMLHVMMPESRMNPEKAKINPFMFVDTGVPAFFHDLYELGGMKTRMVVKVAGGANVHNTGNDRFKIGKRGYDTGTPYLRPDIQEFCLHSFLFELISRHPPGLLGGCAQFILLGNGIYFNDDAVDVIIQLMF